MLRRASFNAARHQRHHLTAVRAFSSSNAVRYVSSSLYAGSNKDDDEATHGRSVCVCVYGYVYL